MYIRRACLVLEGRDYSLVLLLSTSLNQKIQKSFASKKDCQGGEGGCHLHKVMSFLLVLGLRAMHSSVDKGKKQRREACPTWTLRVIQVLNHVDSGDLLTHRMPQSTIMTTKARAKET